ncbi:Elongation factor 1-beta isoform 5 [Schistosoma japonicum]|uniref:Elongation factor 1-beta isoform 5 n=1 Tax=Schistosoma japonicum TaxID=6182 RepID=A0A4Z2DLI0_SCHJA|nr:Elongation factor 1-beta [Schistosoma japonicum]TNN17319.1 Elongation factor 1-beta isoform 5 [Schistosoma japonicum]TNN17320.1 Elongation factor 1-beta isoform 5 [Schistosoma japonicum]
MTFVSNNIVLCTILNKHLLRFVLQWLFCRFQPTQADASTYIAVGKLPSSSFGNVGRWYRHIDSFGAERKQFPAPGKSDHPEAKVAVDKCASPTDNEDDLFGSDDDEEYEKLRSERQAVYEAKKANKTVPVAKSTIVLDVKPWDDETNMADIETAVRSIQADGLLWGASKLVPLAYGIKKLQIGCVVEDDKIGTDMLEEEIMKFDDLVQSVDIAAFNKL